MPFDIIITPQRARESEIGFIFEQYPKYFVSHDRAVDYILWVYVMYEKLKSTQSFFYPYFLAVGEPEMLMDWKTSEKIELQDKFLLFEAKKQEKLSNLYFNSLLDILQANSQYFPGNNLLEAFLWSFKLVTTRAFSHGDGMIIPFADNLNHDDVYVDYLTLSKSFLQKKLVETQLHKDYKDFIGTMHESSAPMRCRSHLNRLEKYVQDCSAYSFDHLDNIWEIQQDIEDYESSSDEEELIYDLNETSEDDSQESEESEEDNKADEDFNVQNKYFVMRTGADGGFLSGNQVFNCYGRLNNTDMLIEYGFCLLPNRYDSVYIRVTRMQLLKNQHNHPANLDLKENSRLKDFFQVYYLKYNKLNQNFFNYFREKLLKPDENFTIKGELKIITHAKQILLEFNNSYITTLEEDEDLIRQAPGMPMRMYFALSKEYLGYRISQKRIVMSQIMMLSVLHGICEKVLNGETLSAAHWGDRSLSSARVMYPLRNYLKTLKVN